MLVVVGDHCGKLLIAAAVTATQAALQRAEIAFHGAFEHNQTVVAAMGFIVLFGVISEEVHFVSSYDEIRHFLLSIIFNQERCYVYKFFISKDLEIFILLRVHKRKT
jgi:hypothetical protein